MVLNLDQCIEQLYQRKLLSAGVIRLLCEKIKEILVLESNVHHISTPVTVVGDIHGQFYDLLEIFKIGGYVPDTNYLFLGDYVDRGNYSVETISLLTCLKLRFPHRIHLLRGNHESKSISRSYGFYTECVKKYESAEVWKYFTDMFDFLGLSVLIDNVIFCVHGGLSPSLHTIDQLRSLNRFKEIPHDGPIADLVWSDPEPDPLILDFGLSPRGAGFTFGSRVVNKFLYMNQCQHILRGHQLCMKGFQLHFDDRVSTIWSAPNYCYRCGNRASILELSTTLSRLFNLFDAAPEEERGIEKKSIDKNKKHSLHSLSSSSSPPQTPQKLSYFS